MYELLKKLATRPQPFSEYTAKDLWTKPHLARQMLNAHTDYASDRASYRIETIRDTVEWIDSQLAISGKSLCDLGCGPGLYTQLFALNGADVTGVDFSEVSLQYAREKAKEANVSIQYLRADYLQDHLPEGFDIITLIFTDLCVLSPSQRASLLAIMRGMLSPGGKIVIDVGNTDMLNNKQESVTIENQLMQGFWSEGDYVGVHTSHVYSRDLVSLDHFFIVEPTENWQIFNWFQYYTPESIEVELRQSGFRVEQMVGDLTGIPLHQKEDLIGVIATAD